jgi:hypothetical protein
VNYKAKLGDVELCTIVCHYYITFHLMHWILSWKIGNLPHHLLSAHICTIWYSGFTFADNESKKASNISTFFSSSFSHQHHVGNLPQINIDTLQHLLGLPYSPLSYPYSQIAPLVSPSWLTTSWEFFHWFQVTLRFSNPWHLPLERDAIVIYWHMC